MNPDYWWVWMIVAAVFVVGEIFTAGFFLLVFGIGAAVAGVLALFDLGAAWQWVAFIVVSFVSFLASRRFADRVSDEQPPGIGADRFIGEQCVVLEAVESAANTGRVRMNNEEWRADSTDGESIAVGERVVVTGIRGTHLLVRPLREGQ
jgi:membrane protein implicated in regulation of membrane protease activity